MVRNMSTGRFNRVDREHSRAARADFDSEADSMLFNDKKKRLYNVKGRKKMAPWMARQAPSSPSIDEDAR